MTESQTQKVEAEVRAVGALFDGRLNADVLSDALSYVGFGECRLAVETLCDQLYEYGVEVTREEVATLKALLAKLGGEAQHAAVLGKLAKG
ncbi:MafI family immunity protein [Pseudenhygromyxa sp. WMMC2535]|uniref:MafI family immunity protein n=1 Tax=Pseudenhygromyxa sp. WMMC2535 TaxID=2712867 RepID=UPI001556B834|nr:MafI family immunity protein [Pseudenhygromyxa sp. WMMC2535]